MLRVAIRTLPGNQFAPFFFLVIYLHNLYIYFSYIVVSGRHPQPMDTWLHEELRCEVSWAAIAKLRVPWTSLDVWPCRPGGRSCQRVDGLTSLTTVWQRFDMCCECPHVVYLSDFFLSLLISIHSSLTLAMHCGCFALDASTLKWETFHAPQKHIMYDVEPWLFPQNPKVPYSSPIFAYSISNVFVIFFQGLLRFPIFSPNSSLRFPRFREFVKYGSQMQSRCWCGPRCYLKPVSSCKPNGEGPRHKPNTKADATHSGIAKNLAHAAHSS
jgi:hypothetical protein